jgi:transcriptional regulator with XRE-family HTH domain
VLDLGKTIRILRQARGWKLSDLADKAKVSVSFLSLVESGDRQPSLDVLRRVAQALKLPSEALILMSFQSDANLRGADPAMSKLRKGIDRLVQVENQLKELLGSEDTTNGVAQNSTSGHRRRSRAK